MSGTILREGRGMLKSGENRTGGVSAQFPLYVLPCFYELDRDSLDD